MVGLGRSITSSWSPSVTSNRTWRAAGACGSSTGEGESLRARSLRTDGRLALFVCQGMAGFVEQHLNAAGQHHRRADAPTVILRLAAERDPLRPELGHRGRDVVAHERELVMRPIAGVDA